VWVDLDPWATRIVRARVQPFLCPLSAMGLLGRGVARDLPSVLYWPSTTFFPFQLLISLDLFLASSKLHFFFHFHFYGKELSFPLFFCFSSKTNMRELHIKAWPLEFSCGFWKCSGVSIGQNCPELHIICMILKFWRLEFTKNSMMYQVLDCYRTSNGFGQHHFTFPNHTGVPGSIVPSPNAKAPTAWNQ